MRLRGATTTRRTSARPARRARAARTAATASAVVGLWVAAGVLSTGAAVWRLWSGGWPGATAVVFAAVFGALMVVRWARPFGRPGAGPGETTDFEEAFFVLLILLVSPALTVVTLGAAAALAPVLRRRPAAASAITAGRVATSAGAGALVFVAVHGSAGPTGYAAVGAALAGALCCLVVRAAAALSLSLSAGVPWRATVPGGIGDALLLVGGSVAVALPAALLLVGQPQFLPLAVLPLLVLGVLADGHRAARRDRRRLRGLFEATLEVNRSVGTDQTRAALLGAAGSLFRAPEAVLAEDPPGPQDQAVAAPVQLADRRLWLSLPGRGRGPFGDDDRTLLDALASVGAVALANADLYAEVEHQKDNLSVITHSLGEGVCAVNRSGWVTFVNPAGAAMLGWPEPWARDGVPPSTGAPRFLADPALRAMTSLQSVVVEDTRFERADGTRFAVTMTASPVLDGTGSSAAVLVFRDTSERRAFEEQLARHAFEDPLTGLANRRLLLDHLDHALLQAARADSRVAVLFGDVDRFKLVNDNLGHQLGDELLRVVAERLRRVVRPGDTLARFGGDEFVLVLEGISGPDEAGRAAERVLGSLRDPILLSGDHEVVASMSIGMALSERGSTRDDLLHDADVAMYRAKERGRGGQVTLFDVDRMGERSAGRLDLDAALHHVLERGEVDVYFQPLVSLAEQRIVAAEALVRWDHPEHGVLAPEHFMELAEDNGTALAIGRAVLERACHHATAWRDSLGVRLEVAVNLSARQFREPGLGQQVATVVRATGIEPSQLCLEITESLAMEDVEMTAAVLARLHDLGVRLAIDDFGTGHSSLGQLARFPIDLIKIDRSFVRNVDQVPVRSAIVSAVVALSHAIGSTTVVEGVETLPELEQLESLGCDIAQGFYFCRPLPARAFEALVGEGWRPATTGVQVNREVLTG